MPARSVAARWRMDMELRGAVAIVTGGNGGLGQRICHALAKEGVHLAVMYAQSREQAEHTKENRGHADPVDEFIGLVAVALAIFF